MARLLDKLVSMFGRHNSAEQDILIYARTEYKQDWKHKYNQLMAQYKSTGAWKT